MAYWFEIEGIPGHDEHEIWDDSLTEFMNRILPRAKWRMWSSVHHGNSMIVEVASDKSAITLKISLPLEWKIVTEIKK